MQYTSELKRLVLPEYGRNVQQMVDHCMTIEDKAERTRCANTIINIMGNLFPHLRDIEDFKHKLWDHLAIMSDFKLDIDYPYEIIKKRKSSYRARVGSLSGFSHKVSSLWENYGRDVEKGGVDARWTRKECIGFHAGESYEKVVLSME